MLEHAQGVPELEVCGLLGARRGQVTSVYPVPNTADDPTRYFLMEPRGQIDAMRTMRQAGETLFGIYHSHPSTPAQPSVHDVELAAYPGVVYLIISLAKSEAQIGAFYLDGASYKEVALIIY